MRHHREKIEKEIEKIKNRIMWFAAIVLVLFASILFAVTSVSTVVDATSLEFVYPPTQTNYYYPGQMTYWPAEKEYQITSDGITDPTNASIFLSVDHSIAGYWSFDNDSTSGSTASDYTNFGKDYEWYENMDSPWHGYHNDATLKNMNVGLNNGTSGFATGKHGNGMMFDGIGYLRILPSESLNITGNMTVMAWVKPTQVETQKIVSKYLRTANDGYELALSSNGTAFFRINQFTSGNTYRVESTSHYPSDGNTWAHIAGVFNGTHMKFYYNGNLEASIPANTTIGRNGERLYIGRENGDFYYYQGAMDDVMIQNRDMSDAEIKSAYSANQDPILDVNVSLRGSPCNWQQITGIAQESNGNDVLTTVPNVVKWRPNNQSYGHDAIMLYGNTLHNVWWYGCSD